jgi:hypothetical protein
VITKWLVGKICRTTNLVDGSRGTRWLEVSWVKTEAEHTAGRTRYVVNAEEATNPLKFSTGLERVVSHNSGSVPALA